MPLVEYVLLAILGSAPIAPGTPNNGAPRTYGAESIAQPSGSVPIVAHSRADKSASNSNKKSTTDNRNGKKAEKSGKKGSSGTSTPPPK